jgi:ATP-binding cassette, subfamily C (CFTR/MRP), member 1
MPFLAATLFVVQRYYLRTSRQVRLLDIEAKAPLYKLFIETATGVATIRAFRWTSTLHERHAAMLNLSQRPFYMLLCIQQWLSLVLDFIVGALAVVLVCVAISTTDGLSAGTLGVSLVLVLEFSSLLTQTLQAWTKLETSIGAVARVQDFVDTTPREPDGVTIADATWPARGEIQFHNVAAGYSYAPPPPSLPQNNADGTPSTAQRSPPSSPTSLYPSPLVKSLPYVAPPVAARPPSSWSPSE